MHNKRAIIIDDEEHSIETLRWKLEQYCPEVEVIAVYSNPIEGVEFLKKTTFDLLFLDIEMPFLNGFDVLEELGEISFDVIFTTAYDDFGIKAIKYSALDYLLKPIQNQELRKAVDRHLKKSKHQLPPRQLEVLIENVKQEDQGKMSRIALPTQESIEFVEPDEIVVCASDSNYTIVYLLDGRKKVLSKTLKEFEEMLSPYNFFRTHQSHLVNLNFVKEYIRSDGGYLVLKNKMTIPVARSRKDDLLRQF
ncbi:MAG: LytTR family DNA-binding domain-containing protein [Bacteroidota bacterium]